MIPTEKNTCPAKTLPRVLVIHDQASFGKVALSTVIPILTAAGVEVVPLVNSYVSSNVMLPGFLVVDLTEHMQRFLDHFKALQLSFDCVYTGYLASYEQIEICKKAIVDFDPALILVDPVLGDNGEKYPSMSEKMIEAMRELVSVADITTPNLTEACLLADVSYKDIDGSGESLQMLAKKIHALGAKKVMITGVKRKDDFIIFLSRGGNFLELQARYLPYDFGGTGDAYASLIIGEHFKGKSWEASCQFAANYISFIIEKSIEYDDFMRRGLIFEPYLYKLSPFYRPEDFSE